MIGGKGFDYGLSLSSGNLGLSLPLRTCEGLTVFVPGESLFPAQQECVPAVERLHTGVVVG